MLRHYDLNRQQCSCNNPCIFQISNKNEWHCYTVDGLSNQNQYLESQIAAEVAAECMVHWVQLQPLFGQRSVTSEE